MQCKSSALSMMNSTKGSAFDFLYVGHTPMVNLGLILVHHADYEAFQISLESGS